MRNKGKLWILVLALGLTMSWSFDYRGEEEDRSGLTKGRMPVAEKPAHCGGQEGMELAFPCRRGAVEKAFLELADGTVQVIEYELIDGVAVFEGDIILHLDERGHARVAKDFDRLWTKSTGRSSTAFRWPSNKVYYTIDSGLANQARVTDAIAHWEANTNLRFIVRTSQSDYITFRTGTGCSSSVGRQGGQQFINLATGCTTGNTIHEIGHAVGLWHEQSRSDRDDTLIVNWGNIQAGADNNFRTYVELGNDGFDNGPHDLNSIMHYGSFFFSANGQPTLTLLDGSTFGFQRNGLTAGDVAGVDFMYPPLSWSLTGSGGYFAGRLWASLFWEDCASTATNVDVFRSGQLVATTANDGSYTDQVFTSPPGSYNYWVCEAGSTSWYDSDTCSNVITIYY